MQVSLGKEAVNGMTKQVSSLIFELGKRRKRGHGRRS